MQFKTASTSLGRRSWHGKAAGEGHTCLHRASGATLRHPRSHTTERSEEGSGPAHPWLHVTLRSAAGTLGAPLVPPAPLLHALETDPGKRE